MPSREYVEQQQKVSIMSHDRCLVDPEWLVQMIRDPSSHIVVLDCRPALEYNESRVRGALGVNVPASDLMLRRLAHGKLCVSSVIRDAEAREQFKAKWKSHTVVLYDAESSWGDIPASSSGGSGNVIGMLFQRMSQDGSCVVCLQGGFSNFKSLYPEWCEFEQSTCVHGDLTVDTSLLGLETLRISPVSVDSTDSDSDRCDSGLARDDPSPNDPPFPVEILPYLFLGNAENSSDLDALEKHHIRYILNVTQNLPNTFEQNDLGIKYMQIPIQDHWSQNLASFFPEAIAFIEEARQKKLGVLVHCLAGISRSVTITLAYLMHKLRMPLNDAYDFVRKRKANISPNFNFMGQLMDFERQLNLTPCRCTCNEAPCKCKTLHFTSPTRTTPDSGIDIDRWT